jgi:N-formylglutamate deformylase
MIPDAAFLQAFEACTLPPGGFRHRDHVRLAWLYLRDHPLPEALGRFCAGLKRYAASLGKPGLYNETITVAYLTLVNERRARLGQDADWENFARANPDLFKHPAALRPYYRDETLRSDLARAVFILPDRLAG